MTRCKTPEFWYRAHSPAAYALSPLSLLYRAGYHLHQRMRARNPYTAKIPVLCVGNLVAGGSGKTPVSLAVLQLVRDEKLANKPCFLTRGYGGNAKKDRLLVNTDTHTANDVGDEPLLLARKAPTLIARDRKEGAIYAENNGFDMIIMDDGLQNPGLRKDLSIVVIDGATGFGNQKLLPAGPLREPLKMGVQKADLFVLVGEDQHNALSLLPANIPVFRAGIHVPENWIHDKKTPYLAFCGLAHPEKFKATLEKAEIPVASFHPYPDHYIFSEQDIRSLQEKAAQAGVRMITTEKDAVRIPKTLQRNLPLDILPIQIRWENRQEIAAFLKERMQKR